MAITSLSKLHRTFFPKKSHQHPQKNRISKLNKNNLPLLRLFRFFNKLSTVRYLVVSCDCFIIIMLPGKEKFEFGYAVLRHSAFCIVHENVIKASKKFKSSPYNASFHGITNLQRS